MFRQMSKDEIDALVRAAAPKPATLDETFYRDLSNHWSMFGAAALVQKRGRGWTTSFRGNGHPTIFKTKREAMEMADAWVLESARKRHETAA